MRFEKIIGAAIVLIAILAFAHCLDVLLIDGPDGWNGSGGFAGAAGSAGDGGVAITGGSGGTVVEVCGDELCASGENASVCPEDCDHDLVVVVEEAIVGTLGSSIKTYVDDLKTEGRLARIVPWRPGTVQELKSLLFDQVDRYDIEGALLVGNLPAAFYEHRVICMGWDRLNRCVMYEYEEFPTDVYLQDRDGDWDDTDGDGKYDTHGELELDIFVSRLQIPSHAIKCEQSQLFPECPTDYQPNADFYATEECLVRCPSSFQSQVWQEYELGDVECCGPYLLRRYFERVHQYRLDGALVNRSALVFADDDFVHMAQPTGLELLYSDVDFLIDEAETTRSVYLARLLGEGAELLHHFVHSTVQNLYFYVCEEWDTLQEPPECLDWSASRIHRTEIGANPFDPSYDLRVSFSNMYNCHASRFTEANLGMAFTIQTSHGLATIGNTRKGGMIDATVFHHDLAQGASWGEAYRRWYNEVGKHDDRWHLGIVLTGDPMLRIPAIEGAIRAAGLPEGPPRGIETPPELLATDPPGTFEDYKRNNPQFFED